VARNVDLAEELALDALVIALSEWRRTSVPTNPGAWLMTVAKRRAIGRMLAGVMPEDAEVFGLLALMEIQASRLPARIGPDGALVPLTEQNRTRWDQLLIRRGLDALARAEALGSDGPYVLLDMVQWLVLAPRILASLIASIFGSLLQEERQGPRRHKQCACARQRGRGRKRNQQAIAEAADERSLLPPPANDPDALARELRSRKSAAGSGG
jgi:hypothetical protein